MHVACTMKFALRAEDGTLRRFDAQEDPFLMRGICSK
jgi:hypothetical protein